MDPTVTVDLRDGEQASRLARVVLGRYLTHGDLEWLMWEDMPHLNERSFIALCLAIQHEGTLMLQTVRRDDAWMGQDTFYLLECAQSGHAEMSVDPATASRTLGPERPS